MKKALAAHEPPRYGRALKGSAVDVFEPRIRALLAEFPDMPTTVIMERVGWQRGKTVFFDRVAQLRPLFKPTDPASRTEYQAGELAQCDLWFPPADVPLGFGHLGRPPVLVMVTGYSRMITAVMIPTRQSPDLLAGHWALISGWGRVPRVLVWDDESAVGQWRRQAAADRRDERLPRDAGDQGDPMPPGRSRSQGPGGARQRLSGNLVPARPDLHRPIGFQHPTA